MNKNKDGALSKWARQRHSTEIVEEDNSCRSTVLFTVKGREQHDNSCRELPTGKSPGNYDCKETFKGETVSSERLEELGVFFHATVVDMRRLPDSMIELIESEGIQALDGSWWFNAPGEADGFGKKSIMFHLPGWGDGPMAFASWLHSEAAARLWCEFQTSDEVVWEYHKEDWYIPEVEMQRPLTLQETVEEYNLRSGRRNGRKSGNRTPKKCPF